MDTVLFFDLDGVLADFVRGAFEKHGRSVPISEVQWDFCSQIGFAGAGDPTFWETLGFDFWRSLQKLDDGFRFLDTAALIVGAKNIGLLTSPCNTAGCIDGKRAWVDEWLPDYRRRLFTGSEKHLFAGPNKILVDDNDDNCKRFAKAGGQAILAPRPWNARREMCSEEGVFETAPLAGELARMISKKKSA